MVFLALSMSMVALFVNMLLFRFGIVLFEVKLELVHVISVRLELL